MKVTVAKSAGFCFGVKRAVEQCYEQAASGRVPIYTFGPIIHNEQVVEDLEKKGVHVIHDEAELETIHEGTVIIRSHGVPRSVYETIQRKGLTLVDATCPFVRKIHRIVEEKTREGYDLIIIGSPKHPEVQGICGWAEGPVHVIETEEEAIAFVQHAEKSASKGSSDAEGCRTGTDRNMPEEPMNRRLCIVSQTTFNYKKFNNLVEILSELRYDSRDVLNTICNATEERQTEARELAARSDAMIVIGGRHSSNTQKLVDICKRECDRTFYIQKLDDLDIRLLPSGGCLGITAGASTPNNLIEEVSKRCQN